MPQAVITVPDLPESAIDAAALFHADWLGQARAALESEVETLAIALPSAPRDHDDWRRAAARDLGRAYAPKRVNIVGVGEGSSRDALLTYLAAARGVTGQYLAGHE